MNHHLVGKPATAHSIISIMKFFLVILVLLGECISGLTIKRANSNKSMTAKLNASCNSFLHQGTTARAASVDPLSESLSSPASTLNLYGRYFQWIDTSPLVAKSVTAAVVGCFGDVLAQWLEAKTQPTSVVFTLNWVRFNAFFVSGLLFVGPFLHCKFAFIVMEMDAFNVSCSHTMCIHVVNQFGMTVSGL
jgi:hypothetical protein